MAKKCGTVNLQQAWDILAYMLLQKYSGKINFVEKMTKKEGLSFVFKFNKFFLKYFTILWRILKTWASKLLQYTVQIFSKSLYVVCQQFAPNYELNFLLMFRCCFLCFCVKWNDFFLVMESQNSLLNKLGVFDLKKCNCSQFFEHII